MDEEKLNYQLENYNTLSFFKSARGKAVVFILVIAIINILMIEVSGEDPVRWFDIIAILILAFFIYQRSKIALIITMIYWTIAKILTLYLVLANPGFLVSNTIFAVLGWVIGMYFFWGAYQVERERRKKEKDIPQFYCPKCGAEIKKGRSFCTQCGEKIK